MFQSVLCQSRVSPSAHNSQMSKSEREVTLKKQYKSLEKKLEQNMFVALKKCHPNKHSKHQSCVVLWDEIEELSMKMNDIKQDLLQLENDDCWDELECRIYDV